jgi:hypothetical protein
MRHGIVLAVLLTLVNGCDQRNEVLSPGAGTLLSNGLRFTLAAAKASFGIHDTLMASVTVRNQGAVADTIVVGSSLFRWSLQNDSGKVIMYGPRATSWLLTLVPVRPGQSLEIYDIREAIADTSGMPVAAGSYVLKATAGSIPLSLNLTLR